jgi:hypothetical protein
MPARRAPRTFVRAAAAADAMWPSQRPHATMNADARAGVHVLRWRRDARPCGRLSCMRAVREAHRRSGIDGRTSRDLAAGERRRRRGDGARGTLRRRRRSGQQRWPLQHRRRVPRDGLVRRRSASRRSSLVGRVHRPPGNGSVASARDSAAAPGRRRHDATPRVERELERVAQYAAAVLEPLLVGLHASVAHGLVLPLARRLRWHSRRARGRAPG